MYEERIACFVCASGAVGRHGAGALVVEVGVGESDREVIENRYGNLILWI